MRAPGRTEHDARAVELARMAHQRLVVLARELGGPWLLGGPELWSKDELVTEILRAEFPRHGASTADS